MPLAPQHRRASRALRVAVALAAAALAAVAAATPARAADASLELMSHGPFAGGSDSADAFSGSATSLGLSPDGSRVYFTTTEPIVDADTDQAQDLYERAGGATTLLSDRVQGGADAELPATLAARSTDGTRVLILTTEPLVAEDGDGAADVYLRAAGTTTLLTDGPSDSPEDVDPFVRGSADLSRIAFATRERLLSSDDDAALDTYLRDGSNLTHVSDGGGLLDPERDSVPAAISVDGARVFLASDDALTADDGDGDARDVYAWTESSGLTLLTDRVASGPDQNEDAFFAGRSTDGARVFFATAEPLTTDDGDGARDLYSRTGTTTTLLSDRVRSGADTQTNITGVLSSSDGSRAFFVTTEPLVEEDSDTAADIYENSGDGARIVSDRVQAGADAATSVFTSASAQTLYVSADGRHALFATSEPLVAADRNSARDVYERFAGETRLVSSGSTAGQDASVDGLSGGGARAFFHTNESLSPDDTDAARDVYERVGGSTFLLSDRAQPGPDEAQSAFLNGISTNGARVGITTAEGLTGADADAHLDIYQARLTDPRFVDGDPPDGFPGGGGGGADGDDATAGITSVCVQIQPGLRRRTKAAPGGGQVVLTSSQTTDAAAPLRLSIGGRRGAKVLRVRYTVNGTKVVVKKTVARVPLASLKVGRRNKIAAHATLAGGRKVTVREVLAVVRCPVPRVTCKRLEGGKRLRCSSTMPRRARRVRVTVTGAPGLKATGGARVRVEKGARKGSYKLTMTPKTALPAGRYVYRHVATTTRRGERLLAVRVIVVG